MDLGDFPNKVLKVFGVVAASPDKFILDLLIDDTENVLDVFRETRKRFKAPPLSVDGFFERLHNNNFKMTAKFLERYRDLL